MIFKATVEDAGRRLDVWLIRQLPELSRTRLQALLKDGCITVDGVAVAPHRKVAVGLVVRVEIPPPAPAVPAPEPIPLDVLFEDGDLLVLNKPAGRVVHPAAGHSSGTLVNALLYHCHDLAGVGGEIRPGIVHRLDKDTSGAMVVAKNDRAMQAIVDDFKNGRVNKEYLALIVGVPSPPQGRLETLIGRSPHDRKKMSAQPPRGRRAVTRYQVEERLGEACLARIWIETGRTHQIRVHMAHLGHPVIGDRQYGSARRDAAALKPLCLERPEPGSAAARAPGPSVPPGDTRPGPAAGEADRRASRQMLHAHRLTLRHPRDGRAMSFEAPLPADMRELLQALRLACAAADSEASRR